MTPQVQPRKRRNSSKVNLLISFVFHGTIVLALIFFAAREGLLGKQLKKIAVEMVKEKPVEKPKEPEKPKEEPPKVEQPKAVEAPKIESPREVVQAPPTSVPITAPPAYAPPAAEVPSFAFDGGKAVQSSSDPVQLYRGFVEYALRSKWNRPADIADDDFVAEVEVSVGERGEITNPEWKRGSGNTRWDESVRQALATTKSISRTPPTNFPSRVVVRFDVQDAVESIIQ